MHVYLQLSYLLAGSVSLSLGNVLLCLLLQPLFKICFLWYKYCYLSFLFISICMGYLFPSYYFQSVCVFRSKVSPLVGSIYIGLVCIYTCRSCFHIHLATPCLLVGSFSPFPFKLLIGMYFLPFLNCLGDVVRVLFCSFRLLLFSFLVTCWLL